MGKRDVLPGQPHFAVTDHKGFQITFQNGIRISVQWGPGNYCADYWDFKQEEYDAPRKAEYWLSPDAEVALFYDGDPRTEREWITKQAYAHFHNGEEPGDDVLPAVSPDDVAAYVAWAAAQPSREHGEDERKAAQGGEPC